MSKRFIWFSVAMILFSAACNTSKNTNASKVGLVSLDHYFTKNTVALPDEVNYRVITNPSEFEITFGVAQGMGASAKKPDFSGQVVVAVILKATNKPTTVKIDKAEIGGLDMNVYYSIDRKIETQSFITTPAAIGTVPKSQSVKRVNFYTGGVKQKTLSLDITY